jgi:hypothetical protein
MNFDDLIECTRCGSDAAYVQEVNEGIKIEYCLGCGFQSNSLMKRNSEFFEEQMSLLPNLYKELIDEEEDTGKVWMPTVINIPDKGMMFADGTGRDNWMWAAVLAVDIQEDEKEKYPIPNQEGKYYTKKMDMSTKKHFIERDFMEGLSYIGILPE